MKAKDAIKSEYDIQAEDFLTKMDTKITCNYTGHRKYFHDDKEYRSTWECEISRGDKSIIIEFGQSIVNSWNLFDIYNTSKNKALPIEHKYWTNPDIKTGMKKGQECENSTARLILRKAIKAPSAYDILVCVAKYHPETFEDFCGNFGYDTDSRNAEKTYQAVLKQYADLTKLFNAEELEEMAEIQ